jgi:hypothetical protein
MEYSDFSIVLAEWASILSDNFQFWMAATFAVVVVSHTAGSSLRVWVRVVIALLYAVALVSFFSRFLSVLTEVNNILAQYPEVEFTRATSSSVFLISTGTVMVLGSLLAMVLILRPTLASGTGADSKAE